MERRCSLRCPGDVTGGDNLLALRRGPSTPLGARLLRRSVPPALSSPDDGASFIHVMEDFVECMELLGEAEDHGAREIGS